MFLEVDPTARETTASVCFRHVVAAGSNAGRDSLQGYPHVVQFQINDLDCVVACLDAPQAGDEGQPAQRAFEGEIGPARRHAIHLRQEHPAGRQLRGTRIKRRKPGRDQIRVNKAGQRVSRKKVAGEGGFPRSVWTSDDEAAWHLLPFQFRLNFAELLQSRFKIGDDVGKRHRGHVRNPVFLALRAPPLARKRVSSDATLSVVPICSRWASQPNETDIASFIAAARVSFSSADFFRGSSARVTGLKTALEGATRFLAKSVEALRPRPLQPFQTIAQIRLRCFDGKSQRNISGLTVTAFEECEQDGDGIWKVCDG